MYIWTAIVFVFWNFCELKPIYYSSSSSSLYIFLTGPVKDLRVSCLCTAKRALILIIVDWASQRRDLFWHSISPCLCAVHRASAGEWLRHVNRAFLVSLSQWRCLLCKIGHSVVAQTTTAFQKKTENRRVKTRKERMEKNDKQWLSGNDGERSYETRWVLLITRSDALLSLSSAGVFDSDGTTRRYRFINYLFSTCSRAAVNQLIGDN